MICNCKVVFILQLQRSAAHKRLVLWFFNWSNWHGLLNVYVCRAITHNLYVHIIYMEKKTWFFNRVFFAKILSEIYFTWQFTLTLPEIGSYWWHNYCKIIKVELQCAIFPQMFESIVSFWITVIFFGLFLVQVKFDLP